MEIFIAVACLGFALLFSVHAARSFRLGKVVMGLMHALTAVSIAAIGLYTATHGL